MDASTKATPVVDWIGVFSGCAAFDVKTDDECVTVWSNSSEMCVSCSWASVMYDLPRHAAMSHWWGYKTKMKYIGCCYLVISYTFVLDKICASERIFHEVSGNENPIHSAEKIRFCCIVKFFQKIAKNHTLYFVIFQRIWWLICASDGIFHEVSGNNYKIQLTFTMFHDCCIESDWLTL